MINTAALARMKRTAILVNVARGGVVAEADLADALRRRVIRGAAMDVYSIEPLPADSELLKLDNIVVTPHLAAATADTFEPTVRRMFDNMARVDARRGGSREGSGRLVRVVFAETEQPPTLVPGAPMALIRRRRQDADASKQLRRRAVCTSWQRPKARGFRGARRQAALPLPGTSW